MENVLNMPISPTAVGVALIAILIFSLYISNKQKIKQKNDQLDNTKLSPTKITTENNKIAPEVLAVITAAVASTMQKTNMYRITTIKRIDISPNWKMINKYEQIKANN